MAHFLQVKSRTYLLLALPFSFLYSQLINWFYLPLVKNGILADAGMVVVFSMYIGAMGLFVNILTWILDSRPLLILALVFYFLSVILFLPYGLYMLIPIGLLIIAYIRKPKDEDDGHSPVSEFPDRYI